MPRDQEEPMGHGPDFDFIVLTTAGLPDPSLAIAGSRAGAIGVLNLEFAADRDVAVEALGRLVAQGRGRIGVLLDGDAEELLGAILAVPPLGRDLVIVNAGGPGRLAGVAEAIRGGGRSPVLVANSLEEALAGQAAGFDAIIAKGHEAGGWVGDETSFVLLQRLIPRVTLPIWVYGGVGRHTAPACLVAGAAGAVLDGQLFLTRESPLGDDVRARLSAMDGSETACPGASFGASFRFYARPDLPIVEEMRRIEADFLLDDRPAEVVRRAWREAVRSRVDWRRPESSLLVAGQDATFGAGLARRFGTVGGILDEIRRSIRERSRAGLSSGPLAEGSPMARSHGTRYPIVQGPMTRVSDSAGFAAAVAESGGLPFLALALMRSEEARALLEETSKLLGDRPWGVGILGFVPPELRAEQLEAIRAYRPPFALIAGGRPDQARVLEGQGIPTYLHVPSPGLLGMFLQDGARRFVFEGRECGGHVGPRTSFVLWESMIEVLVAHLPAKADHGEYHVLFAGGVHDGLSAAMVAAMAAPLLERGVRFGVLVGTAYLFTEEAVRTGAIVPRFHEASLACERTVLLESGPGHAIRCVPSPFIDDFAGEKRRLIQEGHPPEVLRHRLEELNIGRLRVASKGVDRDPRSLQDPTVAKFLELDSESQWSRGMYMIGQVAALRDGVVRLEDLHRDISEGSTTILAGAEWPAASSEPPMPPPAAIAIVGMGCILPGAPELRAFWANILNKVDAITEVPASRWDWRRYFAEDRRARDKIYSRWGGFIDDVAFDPATFGMPPSSLSSIEPFQLLALSVVREALRDAGYLDRPLPRERTSVILGAGGGGGDLTAGYMIRSGIPSLFGDEAGPLTDRLGGALPEWTEDSFPGILMNVAAGRVANRFDLGGANYTIDAACASSLAAVNLAVRDLEARTSDVAIVGGVDAIQNPFAFLCFSKTQALSPTGRCRTFDEQGDGIAISEGFAAVILKRLDDAERDGDRIYAVIRGVGASSDGRDRSLTAPRPEGQIRALRRAHDQAGYSPTTVGLIEAHGTGTVAGDQAEIQALSAFFGDAGAARRGCAVGSVKSMIGHTKATAGVAGLIKVALALRHKVLPATLGVTRPNPKANFPESPFYVNSETRPWIHGETAHPRRAGVSAFGFGGTNFHVAMEEYVGDFLAAREASTAPWPAELLVWRGRTRVEILKAIASLEDKLSRGARPALADLAATVTRLAGPADVARPTLAIVATSIDDLATKLGAALELLRGSSGRLHDPRGIHFAEEPLARSGRVAFLFPGQGSQSPNMLRDLAVTFAGVRECFERADRSLADELGRPLSGYIFPPPAFDPEEERALQAALTDTAVAQPALGVAGLAIAGLLRRLGVEPQMVAGHSFGEFIALCEAGCFGEETLLQLAAARGRFIREGSGEDAGAMAAVDASPRDLEGLRDEPGVTLANMNAPRQTVISGPRASIDRAVEWCRARGFQARPLPVACAFHSPLVAPAQARLADRLLRAPINRPTVPVYSNTTAAPYPDDPAAIAALLAEHLVRPVEFVREVEAMYEAGARLFVEVGPRNVLSGLVGRILGDRPHICTPTDVAGRPGVEQLLRGLAMLVAEGVPVRAGHLFDGRPIRRLELSALEKETGHPPITPTTWLVNGGKARPARQKPAVVARPPVPLGGEVADGKSGRPAKVSVGDRPAPPHSPGHGNGHPATVPLVGASSPPPREPIPSRRAVTHNGEFRPGQGAGTTVPRPIRSDIGGDGVTMTRMNAHPPRISGGPAPNHRLAPHLEEIPPPPAGAGNGATEMVRQFQQVMMRFLHTQETVMHDLVTFMGSQGPVAPDLHHPAPHAPGVPTNGNGARGPAYVPAFVSPPAAHAPIGTMAGVAAQNPSRRPAAENGTSHGPAVVETLAPMPANGVTSSRIGGEATVVAPPEPDAPGLPDREQLTEQLLAIVGERTGYPEEMLALDVDLEADLGIDSIKRVEIAGTMIRSLNLPAGSSPDLEKLTGSRTIRQVVDNLEAILRPSGSLQASGVGDTASGGQNLPFEGARTGHGVGRFALKPIPAPALGSPAGLARGGVVVLVDDGTGVGRRLAGRLGERGHRVVRVVAEAEGSADDPAVLVADLGSPEGVAWLIEEIRGRHGRASALIHLAALRSGAAEVGVDPARWRRRQGHDLASLFLMAQALRSDLEAAAADGGAVVLAASALGGTFAIAGPANPIFPGHGGITGFLKTLAREWPTVRIKAVDVPPDSPEAVSGWLMDEASAGDGLVEVGYGGGVRTLIGLAPEPLLDAPAGLPLDGDSVVLITGGARGITAEVALSLAEAARPTLVMVGRTPEPDGPEEAETAGVVDPRELKRAIIEGLRRGGRPITVAKVEGHCRSLLQAREVRENLARVRRAGSRVFYHACDVRDSDAFGALVDEVYRTHGRIDGVIHGAGVIEDRLVRDKDLDSFNRVVETKVGGAVVLAGRLRPESLRFLVLFSSVSGRFGNRGQGDYAAASEVLNKLAQDLDRSWPGRVVSINWGPWLQAGMVSPEVQRQFAERGVALIPPAVGCRMLVEELGSGRKGRAEILIGGAEGMGPAHPAQRGPAAEIPSTSSAGGAGNRAGTRALPLLGTIDRPSIDGGSVELVRALDPRRDLYLDDHRLDGRPVLPFAMAMELMAEVAASARPGLDLISLRKIRLLRGIVVEDDAPTLRIQGRPRAGSRPGLKDSARGLSLDMSIEGPGGPRKPHYRAIVELGSRPVGAEAGGLDGHRGIARAGEGAGPMPMGLEEIYREWLFHGPLFRGIVAIESIGPHGARATLRPSSPGKCLRGDVPGHWLVDPVVVDSAFQMQVIWARMHWGMTLLPAGVEEYRGFDALRGSATGPGDGLIRYELRIRPESQAPLCHADHYFRDHDGRLLGVLTDVEGTGTRALNRLAGSVRR